MTQRTRQDMAGMSPQEISDAHDAGQFDLVLGRGAEYVALVERAAGVLGPDDITALRRAGREDLIVRAHEENRINLDNDKDQP